MSKKPTYEELERRVRELEQVVSEINKAKEALDNQKHRLDYILQGTNVGTWEWNVQTGEAIFNERWAEIIGYKLEEISPASIDIWTKFCHPDDLKESERLLQACFSGESNYYCCECRMRHKNGSWVWILDRGKVATWTLDGKPEWMYGTHQDITARKQAEEALQKSKEKYQELAESISDVFFAMDKNLRYTYWNKASEILTGIPAEKAIGKTLIEVMPDNKAREQIKKMYLRVIETQKPEQFIAQYPGSEQIIHEINVYPTVEGVTVIVKDITERERLEKEKEKLINDLQNALAQVKTLKGLLPICSKCKNIRDDQGYWNQIEAYIRNHSEAEFSHSICPECAKKLYPDLDINPHDSS